MAIPYNEPGLTIRELESPSFNIPTTGTATLPAIVGPSRGYREVTDVIQLIDNRRVTLSASNVDLSTVRVTDASDPSGDAFVRTTPSVGDQDYDLVTSGGVTEISRTMQTSIGDGEKVVTYFENSATPVQSDGKSAIVTLDRLDPEYVDGTANGDIQSSSTQTASLRVQNRGVLSVDDYTISDEGSIAPVPSIVFDNTNGVIGKYQTLYLDYTIDGTQYTDQAVQLDNTNPVDLPAGADDIIVKNAPDLGAEGLVEVDLFDKAESTTDDDYVVTGSGATLKIARSQGSTAIGGSDDELRVRVTYQAAPADYWLPTRAFNPAEVEAKYGPALDADGNINSPVSFAAGLAFANGASEVVVQALHGAGQTAPTGSPSDWATTLQALRVQEDVNIIVPIVGIGGSVATSNDSTIQSIISTVKSHIDFMRSMSVYCVAVCGTDSTLANQGTQAARRSLAQTLASEDVTIVSPASYSFVNNLNRRINVGGQYAAACLAGALARYPVQATMTRKTIVGLSAVNEIVDRLEKNRDAASGLTVLENVNGRVRVRHGLTTDVSSVSKSELNVIRSKHRLLDAIHNVCDEQIIGRVPANEDAPITVQLAVGGVLESMRIQGVVSGYAGLSASLSTSNPTQVNVRFAYKPPFAINYISVEFSVDLGQGSISLTNTPTLGA